MDEFARNIINIYGEPGRKWLTDLPEIIKILSIKWQLNYISPVGNMTYNYVAKAISQTDTPLILKISCDPEIIAPEKEALMYFYGKGSIKLIDYSEDHNAILLHQAVPGVTLKSFYPARPEFVMDNYVSTMQQLHQKELSSKSNFGHISAWLEALDECDSTQMPKNLLEEAVSLKNKLLNSLNKPVVLHGDLHHDNILQDGEEWLAIDPKGIIGDAEFEIAAFDFITKSELQSNSDIKKLFEQRVNQIAKKSNLNPQRIKDWIFVRLILSAAWSIEDKSNPDRAIKLASNIR
ncbi:MAG: phosphotransferase [Gammaproteobacteria bacterium]|nr:phosphotransferase [Gammaproteobacteria bacterium]